MYKKREKQNWPQIIEAVAKMVNAPKVINKPLWKICGAKKKRWCKMDCCSRGCIQLQEKGGCPVYRSLRG